MQPIIVGISGPSCAGKSSVARLLADSLPKDQAIFIGLDSYYRDLTTITPEEVEHWNFDRPTSLDIPLLHQQVRDIASGVAVEIPVYLYPSHTRAPERILVAPRPYVIIEGLYALYWAELRELMALKVFIDLEDSICLERRLKRDVVERKFKPDYISRQYKTTVYPMFCKYVLPSREFADIIVSGQDLLEVTVEKLKNSLKNVNSIKKHL